MGKFKMPTAQQFLNKKTIYGPKTDPVWVFLEREMREMEEKNIKPYNIKVGEWLLFLRDLRYYFYCEAKRKKIRAQREVGPIWYCEFSSYQREVLSRLKDNIHQDLLEDLPNRTRKSMADLGLTLKVPKYVLMQAMLDSIEDPGVFLWNLYKSVYKMSPSILRSAYDMNAKILMSSLVFIDLDECIERLEKLTEWKKPPPPESKKKINKYYEPKCRYGEYLQKMYVPFYSSHGNPRKSEPDPIGNRLRLRSQKSYEALCEDTTFLEKRKERNTKQKQTERVCTYKFWEPPSTLRNTDPKMVAYVEKLKMIKLKARAKFKATYKNMQYQIAGVSFPNGKPRFLLANVSYLPTGYIPINGGTVEVCGEMVTTIQGYWMYPRKVKAKCQEGCDCLNKWGDTVMNYLEESKCKCGHLYDFQNQGRVEEKYFHPANRHGSFWFDKAKVYQMDPVEDFIKDTVREALLSKEATPQTSEPTLSASGIKEKDLLAAFLADISDSPLLIPHLPQACLLNNLQAWVRKRVKGNIEPKEHKQFMLKSQRRWLDLKHMDFRERAYRIPFTLKQLEHMTWAQRKLIMCLFRTLLDDFVTRNQMKLVEQTQLWWPTMKYDSYPSKAFLDIFFTYMPSRMKDTFLINPYSSERTPKHGAKTCPL